MGNNHTSSKNLKANSKVIPFERKGRPGYIHDVPAFLKQTARERDDQTVTISDPNSDAGLCTQCGEPAPIEYAYTVPFRDDPESSVRVYLRFCAEDWPRYVEEKFCPSHRAQEKER